MKIRKGFVTNSSSSSYICSVCGTLEGGYDCCLSDIGMKECINGHTFCEVHAEGLPLETRTIEDTKEMKKLRTEMEGLKESLITVPAVAKPLIQDIIVSIEKTLRLMKEDLETEDDYDYEVRPELCPICSFIAPDKSEAYYFLLKKAGYENDEAMLADLKESCGGNYRQFLKDIGKAKRWWKDV